MAFPLSGLKVLELEGIGPGRKFQLHSFFSSLELALPSISYSNASLN